MYELPTQIILNDSAFTIRNKGDFRMVLDCFKAMQDIELSRQERALSALIIFYEDLNGLEDLEKLPDIELAYAEMVKFFNCGRDDAIGLKTNYRLIDWEEDEAIVTSAINKVAGKEIRWEPYIHWWTFMGYYMAVNESVLSTVISIRHKIAVGKKLEKHESEFRRQNPQYFLLDMRTIDAKEEEVEVRNLWNSN